MMRAGSSLAPVAIALAAAAACGGSKNTCEDQVARMREVLSAPYDTTVQAHQLATIEQPDGVGRTPGAIVVWFSPDANPYVKVGTGEPTNWAAGAGTEAIVEDLVALITADKVPVIELEIPRGLAVASLGPLLEKLSAFGTVHLMAARKTDPVPLASAPDEVKKLLAWLPTVPEDQADQRFQEVFDTSMGGARAPCADAARIAMRLTESGQHDSFDVIEKLTDKIATGIVACKCEKMNVDAFAHLLRSLYTNDEVVWVAVRFAPDGARKLWLGGIGMQLVQGIALIDAETRAAGIDVSAQ